MHSRYEHARRAASTRAQAKVAVIDTKKIAARRRAMSWAVIVAVGATLLLMLAQMASAASVKSARGYSIAAPAGWRVVKSGAMGTDMILLSKPANNFQPNINVVVQPLPPGMNLQKGRAELDRMYSRMFAGFKWISRGTTKVGGATSLLNVASYNMGTPPRKLFMYQVVAPRGKNYYSFTGTSLLSQRAAFQPQFAAAFRSIKWTR